LKRRGRRGAQPESDDVLDGAAGNISGHVLAWRGKQLDRLPRGNPARIAIAHVGHIAQPDEAGSDGGLGAKRDLDALGH
jgi:hypothetical protein